MPTRESLGFSTDPEDECEPEPSVSAEYTQWPDKNNTNVNQENYFNQYQEDNYEVVKYGAQ